MNRQVVSRLRAIGHQLALLFAPGSSENNKAQELIEYALLIGFIAVSVAATIPYHVTAPVSTIFSKIQDHLQTNGAG